MKLKKLVTITSLLLMLLLVFSSCENKVTTTLLTIDLDYRTPLTGETVAKFKDSLSVQETWTTGKTKGLRSTDDATITEKGSTTPLKDTDTFVANKTYTVVLNYKYYDSTEKTTIITKQFTCASQAKTVRVEYNAIPTIADTADSFKEKLIIYLNDALTGTSTLIPKEAYTLAFNKDGQLRLDEGANGYTLTFTKDGITYNYQGTAVVDNEYKVTMKSSPFYGQTVEGFKANLSFTNSAGTGVSFASEKLKVIITYFNGSSVAKFEQVGQYNYQVLVDDKVIYSGTFDISNSYRAELLKTPYAGMPYDDFIKAVRVYKNIDVLTSESFTVKLMYGGTKLKSGDKLGSGAFDYSVDVLGTCVFTGSFSTKSPRYATMVTLVNRYEVSNDDPTTRNYVASRRTYNFYDTINEYGGKRYTAPDKAEITEFKLSDLALSVSIDFDDGSKITQMSISDPNLPGNVICRLIANGQRYNIFNSSLTANDVSIIKIQDLVNYGVYSGIYDIEIEFEYDIQKGEALRSRALGNYQNPQKTVTEELLGAFVFNTYFPVIFKDNTELANTKDQYQTRTLTIKGVETKQRFVFTDEEVTDNAGTKLDNTKYGNGNYNIFTIGNAPTLLAIPTAVDLKAGDEFGHVWLRYSDKPEYLGTIDTTANQINKEFGRYVGAYNAEDTRFVFDHWNNEAETEEGKKNVSKADYSVTVDTGVASGNILTAQYKLESITEKVNNVDFVKVPVGFQFPYFDKDVNVSVDTITAPFSMSKAYVTSSDDYYGLLNLLNKDSNSKYHYYGYVDKAETIDIPALSVKEDREKLLYSVGENSINLTDEELIANVKNAAPTSHIDSANGVVIKDPSVTVKSDGSGYRLVTVSYTDEKYESTTPDMKYSFRVYNGKVDQTLPMYIEIDKKTPKIWTEEEGHPYSAQYYRDTTVNNRITNFLDNGIFKIMNYSGTEAKDKDGNTLKPTIQLYETNIDKPIDGTKKLSELTNRHYILKATYVASGYTLEADYSITINNLITADSYDIDITPNREVYRLATGPGECDLPTVKQAWYALTFGKEKKDYNVSEYAYPYFVDTVTKAEMSSKLGKGLDILFDPVATGEFLLVVKTDEPVTIVYDGKDYEKLLLQGIAGNLNGSKLGFIQNCENITKCNYLLVKNSASVVNP